MTDRILVLELTRLEAAHLAGLVTQFLDLLQAGDRTDSAVDPAIRRLVPDAYRDDPEAANDFRRVTESDLLGQRVNDGQVVLRGLTVDGELPDPLDTDEERMLSPFALALDSPDVRAWLRTLTALRLVLASRLGIETEDDHDESDPRFGIYDWLGYRLDGILEAFDSDAGPGDN